MSIKFDSITSELNISNNATLLNWIKTDCLTADKNTVNPLNLNQWDFYVLNTEVLNRKIPKQKTITLSSLLKLEPVKVKYDGLKNEISKSR